MGKHRENSAARAGEEQRKNLNRRNYDCYGKEKRSVDYHNRNEQSKKNNKKSDGRGDEKKHSRTGLKVCLAIILLVLVAFGLWKLSGADEKPSEKVVFRVGAEEVCLDEVHFAIVQNLADFTAEDLQNTTESDGSLVVDSLKQQILQQIMNYKVEYQIANEQGITLTEEDEKTIRKDVTAYMGAVDARILNQWGISKELVEEVYMQRYLAQKLEKSVAEDVEVEEQRFCTLYLMMFPKIKMTEDGDYARQEDGETPILLSDEEIQKVKENAEKALQELEDGADAQETAKKYGVEQYSMEDSNLVESFEEPFLQYAQSLKENECSPVIEMDAYYAIVQMLSENNKENAEQILSYYKADMEEKAIEEQRTDWYKQAGVGEEPEFTGDTWEKISLYDFVQ